MRVFLLVLLVIVPGCASRDKVNGDSQIVKSPAKEQFDQMLETNAVVLVDFQAEWCPPCKMMKPIIRDLEREYRGQVTVVEVDIDTRGELAQEYGIESLPTFLIFQNGKEYRRIQGAPPRIELVRALEAALKTAS